MRTKPTKGRRWRVSVYPPGVTAKIPTDYPMVHKASRDPEIAKKHYEHFAAQIGKGTVGRAILHQGLLYRGESQYIEADTDWFAKVEGRDTEVAEKKPQSFRFGSERAAEEVCAEMNRIAFPGNNNVAFFRSGSVVWIRPEYASARLLNEFENMIKSTQEET